MLKDTRMKQIIIAIAVLSIVLTAVVTVTMTRKTKADSPDWVSDFFEYTANDTNQSLVLTKYKGTGGEVVINSEAVIGDKTYTKIILNKEVFYNSDSRRKYH